MCCAKLQRCRWPKNPSMGKMICKINLSQIIIQTLAFTGVAFYLRRLQFKPLISMSAASLLMYEFSEENRLINFLNRIACGLRPGKRPLSKPVYRRRFTAIYCNGCVRLIRKILKYVIWRNVGF